MSHDELPLRAEVASAYLDGELAPDERAAAAADPETMALVDSLSVLRSALADAEPAAVSSRTAAIAAALAEFDARRESELVAPAPARAPVVLFRRRERIYRFALGAAAAAVVVIVALAVVNSGRGPDMKSSSATAPAESAQASGDASTKRAASDTEAPSILATEASGLPEINSPEALLQYATAAGSAEDATSAMPAPAGGAEPTTTVGPPATMAAAATAAPAAESLPCLSPNEAFLGDITVLGAPAIAVRDLTTGDLKAIAIDNCRVVFTVLP